MTMKSRVSKVSVALIGLILLGRGMAVHAQADYPWIHLFENPSLHFAFPDAQGNIVVSSGHWEQDYRWVDRKYFDYIQGRVCFAKEDQLEFIHAPEAIYVQDGCLDSEGRTWLVFGEASDYWYIPAMVWCGDMAEDVNQQQGYSSSRFPGGPPNACHYGGLSEMRFATIEQGVVLEHPDLTDAIPASPSGMCLDPEGRVFVMSPEMVGWETTGYFISWWGAEGPESLRILDLWQIIPDSWVADYPHFGPDGLAYLLIEYSRNDLASGYEYAMLSLNPDTGEYALFDSTQYPLLNSKVKCFYVDPLNIKWFGTDDGLVRFDGETWMRLTTQNSGLPYDRVRQIAYDEIDHVYYVISETEVGWDTFAKLSIFSPTGQTVGGPFPMPSIGSPHYPKEIYRAAQRGVWLYPYKSNAVFYYDHQTVKQWPLSYWLGEGAYLLHLGSTASGRNYCVGLLSDDGTCVMIW